jgi:hypothetical protein
MKYNHESVMATFESLKIDVWEPTDIAIESILGKMKNNHRGYEFPPYQSYRAKIIKEIANGKVSAIKLGSIKIAGRVVEIWCHRNCMGAMVAYNVYPTSSNKQFEPIIFVKGTLTILLPLDMFTDNDELSYKFALFHEYGHAEHKDISFNGFMRFFQNIKNGFESTYMRAAMKQPNTEIAADIYAIMEIGIEKAEYVRIMNKLLKSVEKKYKEYNVSDELFAKYKKSLIYRRDVAIEYAYGSMRHKLDHVFHEEGDIYSYIAGDTIVT